MSIWRKIIKNKRKLIPYIKKYGKVYCGMLRFSIEKKIDYDPQNSAMKKIGRHLGLSEPSEIRKYLEKHMNLSLITTDIDNVVDFLKDDKEFVSNIEEVSRNIMDDKFICLGEYKDKVYDESTRHYRWNEDIEADYRYVLTHYSKVRKYNKVPGVDIKNVWELSRMQYLFAPALMWRLSEDRKYALFVRNIIIDWIRCNRFEEGPNWNISMEVGIRITNILLAFQLVSDCRELDDEFFAEVLATSFLHRRFILNNEENVAGITSNHYLGGLLGILAVSATFPFLQNSHKDLRYAVTSFEQEIQKQVLNDGSNFEGSTSYQRLVTEMFEVAVLTCKNSGIVLSSDYMNRIMTSVEYITNIEKSNKILPQIGDNDSGYIFMIMDKKKPKHHNLVNLGNWLVKNRLFDENYSKELLCFIGICEATKAEKRDISQATLLFPDARQALYKTNDLYCLLSAVDANRFKMGGHTHNDKLAIELCYMGKDFIVDSGTGCYTPFPDIRNQLRSVRAHSTVCVSDCEQNRFRKDALFAMSYDTTTKVFLDKLDDKWDVLVGEANVKQDNQSYLHKRVIRISEIEKRFYIEDKIQTPTPVNLRWIFVLHPNVMVKCNGKLAELGYGNTIMHIKSFSDIYIDNGIYSESYGKWQNTKILHLDYIGNKGDGSYITEINLY